MEKVFAMDAGDKFDVARLGSPTESAGSDRDRDRGPPPRYGDRELNRKSRFCISFLPEKCHFETARLCLLLRTPEKELPTSAHAPEEPTFQIYETTLFTVSLFRWNSILISLSADTPLA